MTKEELKTLQDNLFKENYLCEGPTDEDATPSFYMYKHKRNQLGDCIYTITFRIWDFSSFSSIDKFFEKDPFKYDVNIIFGGERFRIDLQVCSPQFDIESIEEMAEKVYEVIFPMVMYQKVMKEVVVKDEISDNQHN